MVRGLALLLTVFTGFSGLVYEVSWQRSLASLLGSHSEATAAVLGIFLGGLSLGYALFGSLTRRVVERAQRARRPPRLLALYGAVEVAIGLWAFGFLPLFAGVQAISFRIPESSPGFGFAIDVALTILLIGPPTVLMGGTIPILTQALARNLDDATRFHALVYGFNTAGAFAGALAAGFVLVPLLGIPTLLAAMGTVNVAAGASFAVLGLVGRRVAPAGGERVDVSRVQGFALYAGVALLLGFAMMSIQTVLVRLGGLAFGSSHFTFSMVVAVFVLCIALGSLAVSAFSRIRPVVLVACVWGLASLLYILYWQLPNSTYGAALLRSVFRDDDVAFYPYYATAFLLILLILALPVGLAGATLPLIFNQIRREIGDLGHVAGRLYSWNTAGSLLGALLGGYALLFWLDLHHVYRVALVAVVVAASLLTVRVYALPRAWGSALLLFPALFLVVALPEWEPVRLSAGLFRMRQPVPGTFVGADAYFTSVGAKARIIFYDDDPTTSVAVRETRSREGKLNRSIVTNGKPDGSIVRDYPTEALLALLPCLFADSCERAFVIGYGTGTTVGELADLDSMREVTVAEIAQGVIDAAPLFDYGNRRASKSPKIRIVRGDAYRALMRSGETYDVIVSEPSNPWVTGVEMLFSREFLEAAESRLRPGGVYAQWFHLYETDETTVELVFQTYVSVFENASVWYTLGDDLILLGFERPDVMPELDRLEQRMAQPDFAAGLRRSGIESVPALLAHEVLPIGVLHATPLPDRVHTLFHPLLSYRAARGFYQGRTAKLPVTAAAEPARIGERNSLLRLYLERRGGVLSEDFRKQLLLATCEERPDYCATWIARWQHDDPDSLALAQVLAERRAQKRFRRHLNPSHLSEIAALFGESASERGDALTFQQASNATRLFTEYYLHAAPFRREVLGSMWRRCRDASNRCRAGRLRAEKSLGPLSEPDGF